jgi:hypothetical protein
MGKNHDYDDSDDDTDVVITKWVDDVSIVCHPYIFMRSIHYHEMSYNRPQE